MAGILVLFTDKSQTGGQHVVCSQQMEAIKWIRFVKGPVTPSQETQGRGQERKSPLGLL